MSDYDYYTIEPYADPFGGPGGVAVYGHGTYPDSSVLAGQSRRAFLDSFPTVEEARAEWPHADVLDHSSKVWRGSSLVEISGLPECPPDWFDPADAGETW